MSKYFSSILLASTTALAACGGGGGGGGPAPVTITNLGSVSTTSISNGFVSVVQELSQKGQAEASDMLNVFKWVDANQNINTGELANYTVDINNKTYTLQEAWYMLKGYKALYYDGKEEFWENTVKNGKYDDEDDVFVELKQMAQNDDPDYAKKIGEGSKSVDEFKADKGVVYLTGTTTNTVTSTKSTESVQELAPTYVDADVDTVQANGDTLRETVRTTTYTTITTTTVTTTTYDQTVYTYSNGVERVENGAPTNTSVDTPVTTTRTEQTVINSQTIPAGAVSVEVVSGVEISKTVGANTNEREVLLSETKGAETVSGGTKTQVKRTKEYTKTSVFEKLFDRTTTVILEDQRIITYADGSTKTEVIDTRTKTDTVTLSAGTRDQIDTITEEINYKVTVDNPVEETVTEDPMVNVDRSDTYTTTYTDTSGNKVTETRVKPVKTTTIKSKKKVTNLHRSTYAYDDGHVLVIDEDDTVTETALADVVTVENLPEEVVDTKIEVQLVNETTTQETTVDVVEGEPVFVTTHEDVTTVVEADGKKTTTVTRNFTTTVTTTTTTTTTVQKKTVKTYSDGKTETTVHDPEVTVTSTDTVVTDEFSKVISEVVENTNTTTPTVVGTQTVVGSKYYSHLDKTFLEPIVEKVEDVVTYEGTWKVTTRYTTVRTPEIHEHFDAVDTTTTLTYSDGSTKDSVETEYFSRGAVEKPGQTTTQTLEIARVDTYVPDDSDSGTVDTADLGTKTPGYNPDSSTYRTDEFNYVSNKQLSVSNFDVAYSRGWTGKGSTVVIADTGANTSHSDLSANIKYTVDYTNTTMDNGAEHGTHVAGITGAVKNGSGMHGAAFDANLAIAKVSSGYQYSFENAKKAALWGQTLGSVAINVSAEVNYDKAFRDSIVKTAPGEYYSTHWYYGENGYNGAVNEAVQWKSALGDEQVLVKAAGNAGWDYSAGMNQMATATDANGNLILDGQMIVVGNWDENNNKLNSSSNKAGTVCATYQNGVCIDAAQIKDFYIMANGTAVTSTAVNGGYVTMTGTSMAAPVVTGSIAVLHQMWPHMKGKHLVQLVMVTGNKNIPGYDENVHGQGLLDMDAATRPVGATGIPTSGRTNGGVSSVSGGAITSGVSASQISALTDVMVLDSFERDFYIDLGDMTQSVDTRTASVAQQMGAVNYYSGYLSDQQLQMPVPINENAHLVVGGGASDGHALGTAFQGTLGTTKDSTTVYANYNYRNGGFYAQAGVGVTSVNYDKTGMLAGADAMVSSTATVGYEFAPKENTTWGFSVSQPVTVESAKMKYNVPTSRTLDGRVVHELRTVDFKSANREIDLGTYYNFQLESGAQVNTFAEVRTGVAALQKEIEKRVGIQLQYKF